MALMRMIQVESFKGLFARNYPGLSDLKGIKSLSEFFTDCIVFKITFRARKEERLFPDCFYRIFNTIELIHDELNYRVMIE